MKKSIAILLSFLSLMTNAQSPLPLLKISANHRYFTTSDGKPFFWMGDTGWLLFVKCTREDAVHYLDVRQQQGFNVVQGMLLHSMNIKNVYGDYALNNGDASSPHVTPGNDYKDAEAYDYWDHVDYIIDEAAKRGIYMALVPVWGGNVKEGKVNVQQAEAYAKFLAERYKDKTNIIWVDGGDIPGNEGMEVWKMIGTTLKKYDGNHLETYHPRGRYSSSEWFHNESWLDFNMFQSGHRNYAQDTSSTEKNRFGEDNWKYIDADYNLQPVKPTLDGEPSYENIPQGLHDSLQPRWTAADVRHYEYWSVFAGGAGFTYGDNAVMQFHTIAEGRGSFGVRENWKDELFAPGAGQMHYLEDLLLSKDYLSRVPAQEIIAGDNPPHYDHILATKGNGYAMLYTYTGRPFSVDLSKLGFKAKKASWFHPSDGKKKKIKKFSKKGIVEFDPPGEKANGNDWVLILEK
jgi:hypothetical protein